MKTIKIYFLDAEFTDQPASCECYTSSTAQNIVKILRDFPENTIIKKIIIEGE